MRDAIPSARGAPNALTSASSACATSRGRLLALPESQQRLGCARTGTQIPDVPQLSTPDLGAEHRGARLEVGKRLRRWTSATIGSGALPTRQSAPRRPDSTAAPPACPGSPRALLRSRELPRAGLRPRPQAGPQEPSPCPARRRGPRPGFPQIGSASADLMTSCSRLCSAEGISCVRAARLLDVRCRCIVVVGRAPDAPGFTTTLPSVSGRTRERGRLGETASPCWAGCRLAAFSER